MNLEFLGVRGTFPTPDADRARYGGHTICSAIRLGPAEYIVIDAGTGLRGLGERIMREAGDGEIRVDLLLTHFHLDHILGLPFFAPLYSPRTVLAVHAPGDPLAAKKALAGLMDAPYFPVRFDATAARKEFFESKPEIVGKVRVSSCPLEHPQGSVAYRLQTEEWSLVHATDTEHPAGGLDGRLASLADGITWLIYDAMFTPEEYAAGKQGWGHSTWLAGATLAKAVRAKTLVLSHFNPAHTDADIEHILREARDRFPRTIAAAPGLRLGKE
jgi:phosphoribosyl 1,2-cyclic phosphodiesterase